MALTTHPHLAPRLKNEYSYTSTPLWTFVTCYRVNLTFTFFYSTKLQFGRSQQYVTFIVTHVIASDFALFIIRLVALLSSCCRKGGHSKEEEEEEEEEREGEGEEGEIEEGGGEGGGGEEEGEEEEEGEGEEEKKKEKKKTLSPTILKLV
jgi:flagellar biosynthesis/type III secretory pathway M-ring protein FliF/YscJ